MTQVRELLGEAIPACCARALGSGAAVLFTALVSGCWGLECDPRALTAQLAGLASQACGDIDGWGGTGSDEAHVCARRASARGEPFHATSQPASSDGGEVVGWAGDGASFYRVDYHYQLAIMLGPDTECWKVHRCAAIGDLGAACPTLFQDLCLTCADPVEIEVPCPHR